ncbi:hypothetical protein TSOC_004211 [Tetrabaena socialis]|uniref:Uncharacterized protein n=1 Tax=Tetrabaena socialis TaxID=47790 RepID=A0A2J8A9G5_9CHLO|nr:hypothetical protein TSOC_004211 [Tetrabaena socialis]|eukprot:PNH09166.1 hypothetical protein TSOC_004211 [Tetrabaena socialis]
MDTDKILKELYYDPKAGLLSKAKFKLKVKQLHPDIKSKTVDEFVGRQELQQVNTVQGFL